MQPRQDLLALFRTQGFTLDSLLRAPNLAADIYRIDDDLSALCLLGMLRLCSAALDDNQAGRRWRNRTVYFGFPASIGFLDCDRRDFSRSIVAR